MPHAAADRPTSTPSPPKPAPVRAQPGKRYLRAHVRLRIFRRQADRFREKFCIFLKQPEIFFYVTVSDFSSCIRGDCFDIILYFVFSSILVF